MLVLDPQRVKPRGLQGLRVGTSALPWNYRLPTIEMLGIRERSTGPPA